ncbi:MAG: hypothetical protein ACJ8FY_10450 [Gemmataceae bacterium]
MPEFEALQDDNGSWFVNQYTPADDCLRRDTLADQLLKEDAFTLANILNRVACRWWLL